MLTVQQVAKQLLISDEAVLGHIRRGTLEAINVGGGPTRPRWRISKAHLDAFIESRTQAPPAIKTSRKKRPAEVIEFYS